MFRELATDDGNLRCEGCEKPVYHGHFAYRYCCKGCVNRGECDCDCPSLRMAALSRSQWLRGRLELYRHPHDGRYWLCKAKTCEGCVLPWLYLDTLLRCNGRASDQIQLESSGSTSLEWLVGELEMYYDPRKESLWLCPAGSSGSTGYPWIHVAMLVRLSGYA